MILLIGLGNPGEEYAGTYHNVGWEILNFFQEKLEKKYGPAALEQAKDFHFKRYGNLCLVYPDTFMNRSGQALKRALAWFDDKPEEVVVFHDDSDLAIGEYRQAAGGAAGHHGIESILNTLPDQAVLRLRIGIRDPREKAGDRPRRKAGDFVLKKISAKDLQKLRTDVFQELAERYGAAVKVIEKA